MPTASNEPWRDWGCTNSPTTRGCWTEGFNIMTDFDEEFPQTGNTVVYDWEITNSTCDPDGLGTPRTCFRINGQYPGPVLRATWGDTVVVNIKNSMQHNGTSVHWHGVRQYKSVTQDGTPGITECPIPPGGSRTYTFQVTQYGTSLYHSHFSTQYGDGIVGPIVFEGPTSANYDIDLGPYALNEYYYKTAFQVNAISLASFQSKILPPHAGNILINGTGTSSNGTGEYNRVTLTQGKKHLVRLVNIGVDNYLRVSLDNHVMQVISVDFNPIIPFYAETLLLAPGQRHDVIISANQNAGSYWFRAHVNGACGSTNEHNGSAIWTYDGVAPAIPTSSSYEFVYDCTEPSNLAPFRPQPVPSDTLSSAFGELNVNNTYQVMVPGEDAIFVWALNNTAIDVAWDKPTLQYVMDGITDFPGNLGVVPLVSEGCWNYWVIQQVPTLAAIPHPMHLHGHDYFVLGTGSGHFDPVTAKLDYLTPGRRDSASVPGAGWVALAWPSNNPGAWLMHCHIARHISAGLGAQFLEAPSQIALPEQASFKQTCDDWRTYAGTSIYAINDSGL